jgi:hypothetical protein
MNISKYSEYAVTKHSTVDGWDIYREDHLEARHYGFVQKRWYVAIKDGQYLVSDSLRLLKSWLGYVSAHPIADVRPNTWTYRVREAINSGRLNTVLSEVQ